VIVALLKGIIGQRQLCKAAMMAAEVPISIIVGLVLDAVSSVVHCLVLHALILEAVVESELSAVSIIVPVFECAARVSANKLVLAVAADHRQLEEKDDEGQDSLFKLHFNY
jgi:uncharacterized membrane protein